MAFFELSTPRDMLEKAKREHAALEQRFDIDNIFNFFVTAHHVEDYIRKTKSLEKAVVDTFVEGQDLKDCRDLCDKGKHLQLTKRKDPLTTIWSGCLNGAPLNELAINGDDKWVLINGDREVDVKWLAERVLTKWEKFLSIHGL